EVADLVGGFPLAVECREVAVAEAFGGAAQALDRPRDAVGGQQRAAERDKQAENAAADGDAAQPANGAAQRGAGSGQRGTADALQLSDPGIEPYGLLLHTGGPAEDLLRGCAV